MGETVMTKKKILLVDDEKAILKIVGIKLRISGYDVVTASDGGEALDMVGSAQPDLMLLDIIMPGMDGFDVLERLRPASQLPVIVLSARPENGPKAVSMGANTFVPKPFDVDQLLARIQTLLDNQA